MKNFQISKKQKFLFSFYDYSRIALLFAIFILLLYLLVIQIFIVDGLSMLPNFKDREFMLVNRIDYFFSSPKRGEVVVFVFPGTRSSRFVKRIIGLPGERVKIAQGKVFINNRELNEADYFRGETLGETETALKENEYFVLGDNRDLSNDSRYWGTLKKEFIIGKAISVFLPLSDKRLMLRPAYNI